MIEGKSQLEVLPTGQRAGLALIIPNLLTSIRAISTSILFITLVEGGWGFPIYALACLTDVLDGFFARRLRIESEFGGMLDASVDFVLIFSTSLYLVLDGLVSAWFLFLILFAFTKFLLFRGKPVYDPFGKHIGTVLFVSLGTVLFFRAPLVANWAISIASCYVLIATTISIGARWRRLVSDYHECWPGIWLKQSPEI